MNVHVVFSLLHEQDPHQSYNVSYHKVTYLPLSHIPIAVELLLDDDLFRTVVRGVTCGSRRC